MPAADLQESVPVLFDFVARCGVVSKPKLGSSKNEPEHWSGVFIVDRNESQWITKDRDGIAPPAGPMNLGQILRLAGYKLSRPPGLEFFDKLIDPVAAAIVAQEITEKQAYQEVAEATLGQLESTNFDATLRRVCVDWILSDIKDRVFILTYHANSLKKYGVAL